LLSDDRSRQAVELAERYADGSADDAALAAAQRQADAALEPLGAKAGGRQLRLFAAACCRSVARLIDDDRRPHGIFRKTLLTASPPAAMMVS
jgi:hypothetical protein